MTQFTMFQLCQDPRGYLIFYDYKKKAFYWCYHVVEKVKPNYYILLIQPFLIVILKFLCSWIMGFELWIRRLICIPTTLILAAVSQIFVIFLLKVMADEMNGRLKEITEYTEEERQKYICLGERQLKRQMPFCFWMMIGMGVCLLLYFWDGMSIFLLLYGILYCFFHVFVALAHPLQRYKLIRNRREKE